MLSRDEKLFVSDLTVIIKPLSQHGNSRALCWNYVGNLSQISTGKIVNEDRYYCSLCLDDQKALGDKGHIAEVQNFKITTSTGNMNLHLRSNHGIKEEDEKKTKKILEYFSKYDTNSASFGSAITSHEFNRDLLLWFCRDLLPFEMVSKAGMIDFFNKNVAGFELPTPQTLSTTALDDVYNAVRDRVIEVMHDVKSVCVMFDGWTDRYRARSYLGIRVAFVANWEFCIATLGCHVLSSHTSRDISAHVMKILGQFLPDVKKTMITTCHDGAANMVKASELMKVESYQHCVAHALHLLLTVDSMNTIEELVSLVQRSKNIVTILHFKSALIEEERSAIEDKEVIRQMKEKIETVNEILDLDDQFSLDTATDDSGSNVKETDQHRHRHITLKSACPTRWNSTLTMIESIIDLRVEIQNALKRSGNFEACLHDNDFELLDELKTFLIPFKDFTDLVSNEMPTLSLIQLIKIKIKKLCTPQVRDDESIAMLKSKILENVDRRFPISVTMKINQLLDPETKDLIPRAESSAILEKAIKTACAKELIQVRMLYIHYNLKNNNS